MLLVPREQMRHATGMENAAADHIAEDVDLVSQNRDNTYHDIADEDAVPTVTRMRTTPGPLPRVTNAEERGALHQLGNATPRVVRATRTGSRCSVCGRYGHERGDPECVQVSSVPASPAPPAFPNVEYAYPASDADMAAAA